MSNQLLEYINQIDKIDSSDNSYFTQNGRLRSLLLEGSDCYHDINEVVSLVINNFELLYINYSSLGLQTYDHKVVLTRFKMDLDELLLRDGASKQLHFYRSLADYYPLFKFIVDICSRDEGKIIPITWKEFEDDCTSLLRKLENLQFDNNFSTILALTRGGLIPSQLVAYKLEIKDIVAWNPMEPLTELQKSQLQGKNILVVDEINDSGKTFTNVKCELKDQNLFFCSVYKRSSTSFEAISGKTLTHDKWLEFPWDVL